jgi:hypothetical protein
MFNYERDRALMEARKNRLLQEAKAEQILREARRDPERVRRGLLKLIADLSLSLNL